MKLKMIVLDPELSTRTGRRIVGVGILTAIAAGGLAVAAPSLTSWSSGETLTASDLNANFNELAAAIEDVDANRGTFTNLSTGEMWTEYRGYCGSTSARTGNLGNARGAKALCETACGTSGAHMCTSAEVLRSWATGTDVPAGGWVEGPSLVVSSPSAASTRSCLGWGNQYGSEVGWTVDYYPLDGDNPGGPGLLFEARACNTTHAVTCCD